MNEEFRKLKLLNPESAYVADYINQRTPLSKVGNHTK